MDTTPIDDHHDLCGGGAADGYPMREIRAQRGASPGGTRGEQTWGRAIRDCADDAEPHAARDLAPGTIAPPGPACAAFVACALTRWRRGRVSRRARWAMHLQPVRGRAQRRRRVASAESKWSCHGGHDMSRQRVHALQRRSRLEPTGGTTGALRRFLMRPPFRIIIECRKAHTVRGDGEW